MSTDDGIGSDDGDVGAAAPKATRGAARRRPRKRATATQRPDVFHVARDADYLRQLRVEEEFWDNRTETMLSKTPSPAVQRFQNERLTGDGGRQWFETIGDYGEFEQGCVLGAGPALIESHLLERHPQLHLTVYDISGDSLARLQDRLEMKFPGRVETRQEDLNFVTLPADAYDLVVANSCVHHIVNLEHLAFQVNQCLTGDGVFFMNDTVGESYFQFSEEKKRLYQAFVDATHDNPGRASAIRWPDRDNWAFSPFESVRSGEILDIFQGYLREVRVRTAGALLELTLFGGPQRGGLRLRLLRRLVRAALRLRLLRLKSYIARGRARGQLLFLLDSICSDTGYLKPGVAFAIYQKRATDGSEE